jgi:hypothetical protein
MISLSGNQLAIVTNAVMPVENARHVFKTCSKVLTAAGRGQSQARKSQGWPFREPRVKRPTRRAIKTPSSSATP